MTKCNFYDMTKEQRIKYVTQMTYFDRVEFYWGMSHADQVKEHNDANNFRNQLIDKVIDKRVPKTQPGRKQYMKMLANGYMRDNGIMVSPLDPSGQTIPGR